MLLANALHESFGLLHGTLDGCVSSFRLGWHEFRQHDHSHELPIDPIVTGLHSGEARGISEIARL